MTTDTSTAQHPYRSFEPSTFDDRLRIPYTGQTHMRLAVSAGMAHGRIVIDPAAQDLIALHCGDDLQPRLHAIGGEIALSFHLSFGDWLRSMVRPSSRDVAIVLHPSVEWTLAIRHGLAHCELDLAAGNVARIDVTGGCSEVRFDHPLPRTVVPIRIGGGMSRVLVRRPVETGVSLAVSGGAASLQLDDQRFGAVGGSIRLSTRNVVDGAPRYDVHIGGGASDLEIT